MLLVRILPAPIDKTPFKLNIEFNDEIKTIIPELEKYIVDLVEVIAESILTSLYSKDSVKKINESIEMTNEDNAPVAIFYLTIDEQDIHIHSRMTLFDANDHSEEAKNHATRMMNIVNRMEDKLNTLFCDYLELEDEGKIYTFREFQFICNRSEDGKFQWHPYDFVRMTDRPITQQKVEIVGLAKRGIDKKVITSLNENKAIPKDAQRVVVRFNSDGFTYSEIGFGIYPNRK